MTEKKVRELLAVYDYIKSFDLEKVTYEGLRLVMIEEKVESWYDGFRTHEVTIGQVLSNPTAYTLTTLKEVKKRLEYFLNLQSRMKLADNLKLMRERAGDDSTNKK